MELTHWRLCSWLTLVPLCTAGQGVLLHPAADQHQRRVHVPWLRWAQPESPRHNCHSRSGGSHKDLTLQPARRISATRWRHVTKQPHLCWPFLFSPSRYKEEFHTNNYLELIKYVVSVPFFLMLLNETPSLQGGNVKAFLIMATVWVVQYVRNQAAKREQNFNLATETPRLPLSAVSLRPSSLTLSCLASQVCCSPPTRTPRWAPSTSRWVECPALLLLPGASEHSHLRFAQTANWRVPVCSQLGHFQRCNWVCLAATVAVMFSGPSGVHACACAWCCFPPLCLCQQPSPVDSLLLVMCDRSDYAVHNKQTKWGELGQFVHNYTFIQSHFHIIFHRLLCSGFNSYHLFSCLPCW